MTFPIRVDQKFTVVILFVIGYVRSNDKPLCQPFLELSDSFNVFFSEFFFYFGVPGPWTGNDTNLRSKDEFNFCNVHSFVLATTGCDLITDHCTLDTKNKSMDKDLLCDSRFELYQDHSDFELNLDDSANNHIDVKKNDDFDVIKISDYMGNFIIINESQSNDVVEAHDYMGNAVVVWENETVRKVNIRNLYYESEYFEVDLERHNITCYYCNCNDHL
ncbi:hypothetical protein Ddc_07346 [Ditylenchus destructor]|nr:hypothetical protein Ddc_07346 [Ditylenchus destructor]